MTTYIELTAQNEMREVLRVWGYLRTRLTRQGKLTCFATLYLAKQVSILQRKYLSCKESICLAKKYSTTYFNYSSNE